MQLGELFFSLGFKSSGTGEVNAFNAAIVQSQTAVEALVEMMDHLVFLLEEMAVKMGAVSRGDIEASKELIHGDKIEKLGKSALLTTNKDTKATKDNTEASKKSNEEKKKNISILGLLRGKLEDYVGKMNAVRIETMALAGGLSYFVKKASDAARELDKISSLTGYTKMDLQRLGDMAAQTGGSLDDITGAVQNFQKTSIDITLGRGGNIGAYNLLGLNPHDDPMKLLDQIGRKLKTMPAAYGANLARDLGLSDDLIYMLKNLENIKPIPKDTLPTDEETKKLKEFNFYFNRVFEQGKRTLNKFAAFLSPVVTEITYLMDRITMLASKGLNALGPYMKMLEPFAPALKIMGVALFAAIFPATAALLFMMVVLEDIGGYLNGDKSVFGLMIEQMNTATKRAETLTALWATLISLFSLGTISNEDAWKMAQNKMANFKFMMEKPEDANRAAILAGNPEAMFQSTRQEAMDMMALIENRKNVSTPSTQSGVTVNQNITVQGDMTKEAAEFLKNSTVVDFKKLGTAHINFGAQESATKGATP